MPSKKFETRDQASVDRWDRSGAKRGQRILNTAGYPCVPCPRCGQPAKVTYAKDVFDPWLRCSECFAAGPRRSWDFVLASADAPDDVVRQVYGELLSESSRWTLAPKTVDQRTAWDVVLAVE